MVLWSKRPRDIIVQTTLSNCWNTSEHISVCVCTYCTNSRARIQYATYVSVYYILCVNAFAVHISASCTRACKFPRARLANTNTYTRTRIWLGWVLLRCTSLCAHINICVYRRYIHPATQTFSTCFQSAKHWKLCNTFSVHSQFAQSRTSLVQNAQNSMCCLVHFASHK